MVYNAAEDIKFDKNLKSIRSLLEGNRGSFVFDPDSFKMAARSFDVESYRLSEDELIDFGKLASRLRAEF